jgi:chromosome segregation protein
MRLQSLEIKGFKSFADKTVINFKEDVIGIVGPNGCGKSNVVDAIRWVLGEQKSTALRSDKMESVIFNGTKSRKASGVAEVSLTFENTKNVLPTDYTMVTISRVLYRSGESEYRLNGVSCRLKDIATLLIDTGMGSNSYAIIALGMVDDLLADRENSRRRLFEQAAGISKYKSRKQETMTKLKGTEEDLNRVEDLLYEIDSQLKQLERQAKRAKKWVELKDEYRTLSLELAVWRLAEFKETFKSLKEKIQNEEIALTELDANMAKAEAALAIEKAKNLAQEKNLSEKQRELNSLVGRIRGMENDKKMAQQKIDFLQNKAQDLQKQVHSAQSRLTQLADDIDYYRGELNAEKRIEAVVEDNLVAAEKDLKNVKEQTANFKDKLDGQLRIQQQIERQIVDLEKRRIAQQTNRENVDRDIDRASGDMKNRSEELLLLKENRDILHKKQLQQQRFLEDLEDKEADRKEELASEESRLADQQQLLNNKNRTIDAKRNEYKLTKSLVENLEGFPESIRFLNKDKDWATCVPLLSDVLYCQPEYRVAIENFLEPYLNYYISPDIETATEAIAKLSHAQRGRANFILPLVEIRGGAETSLENEKSAINFVEFDEKYAYVFDFLLKSVYLIDDEQEITSFIADLQSKNIENYLILAKNGAFSRGNRTIAGGSVGLFEGKRIGRKKNLEILEREIAALEAEIKTINSVMETLKNGIDKLRKNNQEPLIRRERDELNSLQQQLVGMSTKLDNVHVFLTDLEKRKQQAEENIKLLESQDGNTSQQLSDLVQQQQDLFDTVGKADSSYRQTAE